MPKPDYLPLMLVNMSAALWMVALYWLRGTGRDQRFFAAGFGVTGLVAMIMGLHLCFTWPLPGSYNVMFGELTVMLGAILLAAALAVSRDWSLTAVGVYALPAGVASILVGARILQMHLTKAPELSAAGFFLTGLAGILALPVAQWRNRRAFSLPGALAAFLAGIIWLFTACAGYWDHIERFMSRAG